MNLIERGIMLTLLFGICMLVLFGKLLVFGIRAAWGISKIVLTIVFLPIILIALVEGGLLYIALPILIVLGLISLVTRR